MASPFCFTIIFLSYVSIAIMVAIVPILATLSSLEMEEAALRRTGWWSLYSSDTLKRCTWPSISCNKAGSITRIGRSWCLLIESIHPIIKFTFKSNYNIYF